MIEALREALANSEGFIAQIWIEHEEGIKNTISKPPNISLA